MDITQKPLNARLKKTLKKCNSLFQKVIESYK
jgi:hypothetical protein